MAQGQQFHPGSQSNKSSKLYLVMPHHADIFLSEYSLRGSILCLKSSHLNVQSQTHNTPLLHRQLFYLD